MKHNKLIAEPTPYVPSAADLETLRKHHVRRDINRLKAELARTDYVVIKIAEGVSTAEEYTEVIAHRAELRERINALEEELK